MPTANEEYRQLMGGSPADEYRQLLGGAQRAQGGEGTPSRWLNTLPWAVAQGMTFGLSDEMEAAARSGLGLWGDYDSELNRARGEMDASREAFPSTSLLGEVAGGVAGGAGLAKAGASLLNAAKPTFTSMMGRGAAEGAAYGAAHEFGRGEGYEDRIAQAGRGAVTGGAVGAAAGAVGAGMAKRAARRNVPEIDDIVAAKNAAYQRTEDLGIQYSPQAYDKFADDLVAEMQSVQFNPMRHPKTASMLEDIASLKGRPHSLTELDQLRQVVRRDVAKSTDGGESFMGNFIMDKIDDFIEADAPGKMLSGKSAEAWKAIRDARSLNATLRKSETIDDAIEVAIHKAQTTGSGGNIENSIRQAIRRIYDDPKKVRGFTGEEKTAMLKIIQGAKGQDLFRLVGKLSPSGNGLMAAFGLGATAANPLMAIPVGAGIGAKALSDAATKRGAETLTSIVRTGGSPVAPQISPANRALTGAFTRAGAQEVPEILRSLGIQLTP